MQPEWSYWNTESNLVLLCSNSTKAPHSLRIKAIPYNDREASGQYATPPVSLTARPTLAHSVPSTMVTSKSPEHTRHAPTSEPLYLLFPLLQIFFPQTVTCLASSLLSGAYSNVTFSSKSSLATHIKWQPPPTHTHTHFLSPFLLYLFSHLFMLICTHVCLFIYALDYNSILHYLFYCSNCFKFSH